MKKLNKVVALVASVSISAAAFASDNWANGKNEIIWRNSTGLCWQNNFYTDKTASGDCVSKKAVIETVRNEVPAPVVQAPKPEPKITVEKVSYSADAFFDFDKASLKQAGKEELDKIAVAVKSVDLEAIVAVGHTDAIGSEAYNQKLSERRAASVRDYLVAQGVAADRIFIEGKGKTQPVADNKTREGRAKNRRVEIEVVGSRQVTE